MRGSAPPDKMLIAVDGPTFFTVISRSNSSRSPLVKNPYSAILFSCAWVNTRRVTGASSSGSAAIV